MCARDVQNGTGIECRSWLAKNLNWCVCAKNMKNQLIGGSGETDQMGDALAPERPPGAAPMCGVLAGKPHTCIPRAHTRRFMASPKARRVRDRLTGRRIANAGRPPIAFPACCGR